MKVLWMCNTEIPRIAKALGQADVPCFGGWLDGLSAQLLQTADTQLIYCYPAYHSPTVLRGGTGRFQFYGIPMTYRFAFHGDGDEPSAASCFSAILQENQPDIVHFFGTEYAYTARLIEVCHRSGFGSRVVTSIQGLVGIYALHFAAGLPQGLLRKQTLREWRRGKSLLKEQQSLARRGVYEAQALQRSPYIIGRTSWDLACATLLAPGSRYRHCNETLRDPFYTGQWHLAACKRCQIMVTQGAVPYKGLHQLVMAVAKIRADYPQLQVIVAGPNIFGGNWIHGSSYGRYIAGLLKKQGLTDCFSFVGIQNAQEIKALMLGSHVFVCPSSIENSPNSLGEAMLLGMPCIAADVGGVADMLERNKEGFLYPFDETYKLAYYLKRVFDGGEEMEAVAKAARQRALATHDPEQNNAQLRGVYQEIMAEAHE